MDGDSCSDHCDGRLLVKLVGEIAGMSIARGGGGGELVFKKDCADLVRRVSLLTHFVEEIKEFDGQCDSADHGSSWWVDLVSVLQDAKRLVSVVLESSTSDEDTKRITLQFQYVTKKLEQALAKIPYDQLDISDEVQEQVVLVRAQLRRATERYGSMAGRKFSFYLDQPMDENADELQKKKRLTRSLQINSAWFDHEVFEKLDPVEGSSTSKGNRAGEVMVSKANEVDCRDKDNSECKSSTDLKKADSTDIPEDFLCPISLELMRDPVIVATGQTYERSYIKRWIDSGNVTCPKTQQKLQNLTLTPNYVLRSLISQWCQEHNIEQPTRLANGKLKSNGSLHDVNGDIQVMQDLVRKLTSRSIEERGAAVFTIRSLSKRSTENRILLAEAGAIPVLVNLLASDDVQIQQNAVTSILNLSIHENNKGLIMHADAIPSIVQILRAGSTEAKENAAATLFSLSLADENKILIGASGAIPALIELLEHGSTRGRKDAATALFNLCIYQGNKGRAMRAGIIRALIKMLTDSHNHMIDEALTILSVLSSNKEAKAALVKAGIIPVLIDLLRTGTPRNKENAAANLLSLCKRDPENLLCLSRLGAVIPLKELARNGSERAKRKANSLLEHLQKVQEQKQER